MPGTASALTQFSLLHGDMSQALGFSPCFTDEEDAVQRGDVAYPSSQKE